jgi:hypothetical protein
MTPKLFEVFVKSLLSYYQYTSINPKQRIVGRGTTHQIDAIGISQITPPFSYPITLLAEAKYFSKKKSVGIELARNFYGVRSDIQQHSPNVFSVPTIVGNHYKHGISNIIALLISNVGFSSYTRKFAYAHGIFLVTVNFVKKNYKPYFAGVNGHTVIVHIPDQIDVEPKIRTAKIIVARYLEDEFFAINNLPIRAALKLIRIDSYKNEDYEYDLNLVESDSDLEKEVYTYTYSITLPFSKLPLLTTSQVKIVNESILTIELPSSQAYLAIMLELVN